MSLRFWLSTAIVACIFVAISNAIAVDIEGRIVGGSETHVVRVPYQVSLRHKSCKTCAFEQFASGAIYSKNTIITSANAVRLETSQTLMIVAGTSYRTATDGMLFPVEKIIIHEDFEPLTLNNDIALIRLKVDLPLGSSTAVRALEIADVVPVVGTKGTVAGWGRVSEIGDYSETIQWVQIPILSKDYCQSSYQFNVITENMVCGGLEKGGADACKGDAGSPLVVADKYVGLVSWGVGCGRPASPGVYTNVPQLRAWVEANSK